MFLGAKQATAMQYTLANQTSSPDANSNTGIPATTSIEPPATSRLTIYILAKAMTALHDIGIPADGLTHCRCSAIS